MFVTLNKDSRQYAPSIQYRDFALAPDLFHWESPNSWRQDGPATKRCIGIGDDGSRQRLLFVREGRAGATTSTFRCFGQVDLRGDLIGDRPVAMTWGLRNRSRSSHSSRLSISRAPSAADRRARNAMERRSNDSGFRCPAWSGNDPAARPLLPARRRPGSGSRSTGATYTPRSASASRAARTRPMPGWRRRPRAQPRRPRRYCRGAASRLRAIVGADARDHGEHRLGLRGRVARRPARTVGGGGRPAAPGSLGESNDPCRAVLGVQAVQAR